MRKSTALATEFSDDDADKYPPRPDGQNDLSSLSDEERDHIRSIPEKQWKTVQRWVVE
jgi:hypothetical protein